MIVSQTPYRISFFGGGTDYPAWYMKYRGATLATSINKYCYLFCRYLPPFFEHKHRIVYTNIELIDEINQIKHPAVKGVMSYLGIEKGVEIQHHGDLPARAGMGSSSAFTVGLLNALTALENCSKSKKELAELAIHIEQNLIGEVVGSQDQLATAMGGINRLDFKSDNTFSVTPIEVSPHRLVSLEKRLLLFFTGFQRYASEIAKQQIENFDKKKKELETLLDLVDEGQKILSHESLDIEQFGHILHEGWMIKRGFADCISTPFIDDVYDRALRAGALGGKILGAGGGGFLLLFVHPQDQERVIYELKDLVHIPFKFEFNGTRILSYA
jgi:D-glycero-alpha-D-manno-heptose-7-phosphate kinase